MALLTELASTCFASEKEFFADKEVIVAKNGATLRHSTSILT